MDKFGEAVYLFNLGTDMSKSYYNKPLSVQYSGGKDSDALIEVAIASGRKFEVMNRHTSVDAPPTVRHIRKKFYELELKGIKCSIDIPTYSDGTQITMWNLIQKKLMPPTRLMRYCCSELKETAGEDRVIATGVRKNESNARKSREEIETIANKKENSIKANREIMLMNDNGQRRKMIEQCRLKSKISVNPIIHFSEQEVWEVLNCHKVETNILYNMGYSRVGCVGCPMAGRCGRTKEFRDFPQYKINYIRAFDRMLEARKAKKRESRWKNGNEVFLWWMEDKNVEGQLSFDADGEIYDNLASDY